MPLKLVKKGKIYHVTGRIDGRRYRESTGTRDRERAEAFRRRLERELEDRAFLGVDAAIFADAVAIYIEKGGEARHLQRLLERFEAVRLRDITPVDVSRFAQARFGHMQASSVKRYLYTPLNAIMRAAHRAQIAPLVRFDPPKVKRKPVAYADNAWLRSFLASAPPACSRVSASRWFTICRRSARTSATTARSASWRVRRIRRPSTKSPAAQR